MNQSAPNIWVFIAQLVEHCSANAEAIGLKPVEALNFFRAKICNCINCNYNCDDHIPISPVFLQFKLTSFHVSSLSPVIPTVITLSHPCHPVIPTVINCFALNIWVFIAQLLEHCSARIPVEALNFFRAKICSYLNWDYNCDDHISISSVFPQFTLTSFHISSLSQVR